MTPNPKQIGSILLSCRTQLGLCRNNCNQCYYNRPDGGCSDRDKPKIPTIVESYGHIVRANAENDSNNEHEGLKFVVDQYPDAFYNTSIPEFGWMDRPVVYTANPNEEDHPALPFIAGPNLHKIMFVRLRVSLTNLSLVASATSCWNAAGVPVVLEMMRYYDQEPPGCTRVEDGFIGKSSGDLLYTWRKHILNSYWMPTRLFEDFALQRCMKQSPCASVSLCGTALSPLCKDCGNCVYYYWLTKRRMIDARRCGAR